MERLFQDLSYGLRTLIKKPAFTIVAVLALALGIGANTAIFSVVNTVLLKPLPYKDADRLVMVWEERTKLGFPTDTPAPANFIDWKRENQVFEDMAAIAGRTFNITGTGEPEKVEGQRVSASLFPLLGVEPHLGRWFTPDEDRPGNNRVAIINHGLWQRRFGSDPGLINQTITLNDESYTVVGVMPPRFDFLGRFSEVWVPIAMSDEEAAIRGGHYLMVVARTKTGVSTEQTQADMSRVAAGLEGRYPQTNTSVGATVKTFSDQFVGSIRTPLIILFVAVGFVLLIACANVANLLLARATARQKEIAIRTALGAGRARLVRQFLTESLLLAAVGGACGLALAAVGLRALVALIPENVVQAKDVTIDAGVLAFTLLIALLTGVVFGIVPALGASRPDLNEALKEGGKGSPGAGRSRVRNLLVVAEVALALVLLAGAGLLINSFIRLRGVDAGFNPDNLLTMKVVLPDTRYDEPNERSAFYDALLERVHSLAGVESAAVTTSLPLTFKGNSIGFTIEGRPEPAPDQIPIAVTRVISHGYFKTMGIPLLQGRQFGDQDTKESAGAVVVSETMARTFWPGEDAIGKRIKRGRYNSQQPWITVVGVVGNVRQFELETEGRPLMYLPYEQADFFAPRDLVVRTAGDPLSLVAAVRNEVWAVDRDQPVSNISTMEEILSESLAAQRFNMLLLGIFAAIALVLAAVGIYGVMSYSVTQRTHEIGVRMALGATPSDVLRMVVGHGGRLVLAGIAIGLVAAFALTRVMASMLFGVGAADPATFAAISVVLASVALLASYLPARRATKVDPMIALRYE
jgi:putative ABC transport system permease protein